MKIHRSRLLFLSLALISVFMMAFYATFTSQQPAIALAQGEDCSRPDLPPAPTPVVSQQPTLLQIDTILTNEANQHNWPQWVLRTIAKQESNWRQVDRSQGNPDFCEADSGESACTCVSAGGDYGIMQLNWDVHNGSMDWDRVQNDYEYNIVQGANVLASSIVMTDVNSGDLSPAGQPINWYLKLWGYNGYSNGNNPNNLKYDSERNWKDNESNRIDCPKLGEIYTYQENILYKAKCESNVDEVLFWPAIGDFLLPDDALFESDLLRNLGPNKDILAFDVQTSSVCLGQNALFQYTLDTAQSVSTQITILDRKPWAAGANIIKTLAVGVNQWDGTDNTGQPAGEGKYWFTVEAKNSSDELIGSQSGPVYVSCQQIYLPLVLKRWPPIPYTPVLNSINNPSYASAYIVDWNPADLADTYTLQEATAPDFSDAVTRYAGAATSWTATGKTPDTYYYRVKATNSWGNSSWSNVEQTIVLPTIFHTTKDTTILQGYPDTNFWNTGDMWAGYDTSLDPAGETARSLLGFDLSSIPANTSISQAELWLYMWKSYDYEGASRTITTYRIASWWSETSATWNTQPAYGGVYGSTLIEHASWGWYAFDVTNLGREWINGSYANYGVAVRGVESSSDPSWRGFCTRECSEEYRPFLAITYSGSKNVSAHHPTIKAKADWIEVPTIFDVSGGAPLEKGTSLNERNYQSQR